MGASSAWEAAPSSWEAASSSEEAPQQEGAEKEDWSEGPLSMLAYSVKENKQVLIYCRNGKKMRGRVKAFDRYVNLVLLDVTELWGPKPKSGAGRKKRNPAQRERRLSTVFLRGDSVILVVAITE